MGTIGKNVSERKYRKFARIGKYSCDVEIEFGH